MSMPFPKKNIDYRIAAEEWGTCPICLYQHPPEHEHWEPANGGTPLDQPVIQVETVTAVSGVDSREIPAPTRNKEKYNAYMRRYMSERRKKAKGQGAMA